MSQQEAQSNSVPPNPSSNGNLNEQYDVIVVGGGPAGASAARRAAQMGASVLLIDAATFPRPKPCGGAVSEQAMSYLDFPLEPALIQAEVYGARVYFGDNVVEGRAPFRIAVLTSRTELDNFLLQKAAEAGVQILQDHRVEDVSQNDDFAIVKVNNNRQFRSQYVVAADGAQSVIAKSIRKRLSKDEFAVAYEADIACTRESPAQLSNDLIDIYFGQEYMGYSWIFPKRDHWNIGVGAMASNATNVKSSTQEFFGNLTALQYDPGASLINGKGWIIPAGGYQRRVGFKRIYLTGDAAGFVDPFYGEGIAYAIRSGAQAGVITGAAALNPRKGTVAASQRQYAAFCKNHISTDLRYGLLFARLLHFWPGGLLRLFSTDSRLISKYLDVPAARTSYGEYFRWFVPRAIAGLLVMYGRDVKAGIVQRLRRSHL